MRHNFPSGSFCQLQKRQAVKAGKTKASFFAGPNRPEAPKNGRDTNKGNLKGGKKDKSSELSNFSVNLGSCKISKSLL